MSFSEETEMYKELSWCPECQSPPSSDFAHVLYCDQHMPGTGGVIDHVVGEPEYIARGEAGGESNAAVCAFFHRRPK